MVVSCIHNNNKYRGMMMAWDWKRSIGKLFGGRAQPDAAGANTIAPASSAASPAVAQTREQLASGAYRSYSRAELGDITEALRDLKDATRNNLVVLHNLLNAQPRRDEPAVRDMLAKMKADLAGSYDASERAMVDLNGAANTLEKISARVAGDNGAQQSKSHLPVYDAQRHLVIGVTAQLRDVYTVHNGLARVIGNTRPLITLPEPDRVAQALESNHEKLPDLIPRLARLTVETLGRPPQAAPSIQP